MQALRGPIINPDSCAEILMHWLCACLNVDVLCLAHRENEDSTASAS